TTAAGGTLQDPGKGGEGQVGVLTVGDAAREGATPARPTAGGAPRARVGWPPGRSAPAPGRAVAAPGRRGRPRGSGPGTGSARARRPGAAPARRGPRRAGRRRARAVPKARREGVRSPAPTGTIRRSSKSLVKGATPIYHAVLA